MTLAARWRQYRGLFSIYVQDGIAYKASGLIWVLTDVTTAITMPLVWLAAARNGLIGGYSPADLVLYYLSILMVQSFVTSHFMWEIGTEIREGIFTSHILRPVSYLEFILVRNFAWRIVRSTIFLPFFILFVVAYSRVLGEAKLQLGWEVFASILLGHVLSVMFCTAMGMIALFTQEAFAIFGIYYLPMLFLSGQMFPIALLPPWVRSIADWTPFYYTTGVPADMLVGRVMGNDALRLLGIQLVWIVAAYLGFRVLWAKGMRHYTAVGM